MMLERPPWPESPTVRFLAFFALRRPQLCSGPQDCPLATSYIDADDREVHERCPQCPLSWLEAAMATTEAGRLIQAALMYESDKALGFPLDLAEVTCMEYRALRILTEEREKVREERPESNGGPAQATHRR